MAVEWHIGGALLTVTGEPVTHVHVWTQRHACHPLTISLRQLDGCQLKHQSVALSVRDFLLVSDTGPFPVNFIDLDFEQIMSTSL